MRSFLYRNRDDFGSEKWGTARISYACLLAQLDARQPEWLTLIGC